MLTNKKYKLTIQDLCGIFDKEITEVKKNVNNSYNSKQK